MTFDVRACRPEELPGIIQKLDTEFVYQKQRSISLATRFPAVFTGENIDQILVAVNAGAIRGAVVVKSFGWVAANRVWRGAMVGMVWVDAQYRGHGTGLKLLSAAQKLLSENRSDFGILWTGSPKFYMRAGWQPNDNGLIGDSTAGPLAATDKVACRPLVDMDKPLLEDLRARLLPERTIRQPLDYYTIPIPANQVLCFYTEEEAGYKGFALVGENGHDGYFYEMVAPSTLWPSIWSAAANHFDGLLVNGGRCEPFTHWLTENKYVNWRPQNKAMWLYLSQETLNETFNEWHIPYFDWI